MAFPYRNDYRKTLLPYLNSLQEENWFKTSPTYPNNLAWVISHIATSEDFWINEVALQQKLVLTLDKNSSPFEILKAYQDIRIHTDGILNNLTVLQFNQLIEVPKFSDGWIPPSPPTFNWVFHHIYSHEAYHIGQIGIIAHFNGFPKPLF